MPRRSVSASIVPMGSMVPDAMTRSSVRVPFQAWIASRGLSCCGCPGSSRPAGHPASAFDQGSRLLVEVGHQLRGTSTPPVTVMAFVVGRGRRPQSRPAGPEYSAAPGAPPRGGAIDRPRPILEAVFRQTSAVRQMNWFQQHHSCVQVAPVDVETTSGRSEPGFRAPLQRRPPKSARHELVLLNHRAMAPSSTTILLSRRRLRLLSSLTPSPGGPVLIRF